MRFVIFDRAVAVVPQGDGVEVLKLDGRVDGLEHLTEKLVVCADAGHQVHIWRCSEM